jgi:hypothetical protein
MRPNAQGYPKSAFLRFSKLIGVCLLLLVALLYFLVCHREPPNLTACTRVEVHYTYGALDYFFGYSPMLERILSEEEQQYVRSFDKWTVTDPEQIRAFADHICRGRDRGIVPGKILAKPVDIKCYQGRKRVASFSIYPSLTVIAHGHRFSYPSSSPILRDLDPPALKPLTARWECAMTLDRLWQGPEQPPYPDPNQWCDVIVRTMRMQTIYTRDGKTRREYPDRVIARKFVCPAIHAPTDANGLYPPPDETDPSSQPPDGWVSDYAMNSNCRDGSPDDMVFLFESKPGWNQDGGPELFTLDNHDPKGGCVLLNDGKVKFIRTEEELRQLRWK